MSADNIYVHAATLTDRLLPPDRGDRRLGLGLDRVRAERRPGLPAHLAGAPPRHPGVAVDGHQRVVEQRPVHRDADHARRRPLARAPRGARRRRHRHQLHLRAEQVVDWATRGGARALGRDDLGSSSPGKKADVVLIKNDALAVLVPAAQPLRPRRLPGPAWRRAHRDRRRPGRQAASTSWSAPTSRACGRRSRPPSTTSGRDGRGGLAVRHEPGPAQRGGARQPLPVHRLQVRLHPRGPRHHLRRAGLGGRSSGSSGGTRHRTRTSSRRWRAGSTCSRASARPR